MLNKTLSDRVDSQPSQNSTGSKSESAALAGRNPATYKEPEKELFLENTLKAYFLHLQPRRRREREFGYFEALKREFSVEDIGECLVWPQRFGVPGTGEPCYSPMGFLMHAMGDVLRAVRAAKATRVQAEQDELAKSIEAARNAESEKLEAEEFERKAAKFLHVFPDAKSQEEILTDYRKKNPWIPNGLVAKRLAIQDWWDRVYGEDHACPVDVTELQWECSMSSPTRKINKISDVMKAVKEALDDGHYLDTRHATDRQSERTITRPEIVQVLRGGHREKRKDQFSERFEAWNYAIRGKTIDRRELRVVVSFDENNMLVITAIDLDV